MSDPERERLAEADRTIDRRPWRRWGPYLAERQWGTVREDYSADGQAWDYFPHAMAASRAYRWGEDGIGGFCDRQQRLCLALALWNGRDPILKERLFGLTNAEGNHGEDVKEVYYYLDATPTSSYLRMLYKYPQSEFPYARLVEQSARRGSHERELELADTGVFAEGRYFDVEIEYAKAGVEDILLRVTATNRGPDAAPLWLIPQLWYRNVWSWSAAHQRPELRLENGAVRATHAELGTLYLLPETVQEWLLTENDTNAPKLFGTVPEPGRVYKDAFHEAVVGRRREALAVTVDGVQTGTKAGALHAFDVPAGGAVAVRLRLSRAADASFADFEETFALRRAEADRFHAGLPHAASHPEARKIQRQALAGLLWSRQAYGYDVPVWLRGDPAQPAPAVERLRGRNNEWVHFNATEVLSMPDT